ncbi:MAG: hypothetical protein KUG81_06565 [Gammaproteobacteria bacterium]|nr:hypothetical protein [Gammaproteobacteria bacterium]
MNIFNFSEEFLKSKNKLLIFSGISLFIGLSKALPQKVAIIGLDLTAKPEITGWFLLAVSIYFFAIFLVIGCLELISFYLPKYINIKSRSFTGNVLGFTEDECHSDEEAHHLDEREAGTVYSEHQDIQEQKKELEKAYTSNFIFVSNTLKITLDYLLPLLLFIFGAFYLISYLLCIS